MMRKTVSILIILCIISALLPLSGKAMEPIDKITGETSRTMEEITLADGTNTGVMYTNIQLSGYYGNNREVNIAEADLANTNLSVEVINCGNHIVDAQTMDKASSAYGSSHEGQTVLASVNGDMWMTAIHSNSEVTTKTLKATRGVLIIDGEIWASQQVDQENLCAANVEKGASVAEKTAFGVTDRNQPLIGVPEVSISLDIDGAVIEADGINRLPAIDSIMVYNQRINSSNYALNDSYEVVLTVDKSSAIIIGGTVNATISEIYECGSAVRPALYDEKTIVLTARGSRINELRDSCKIGKKVTVRAELTDKLGNTELWQTVEDAVSGHMRVLCDGEGTPFTDGTNYPTTLIGYKNDGTVSFVTVTSTVDKSRAALKISQSYELCKELGFNRVFYLDGGGSSTFVSLEEGSYTIRNKCSDGSARAVINGVAIVWNDNPVCMRQGSLNHIKVPVELSQISPKYLDGALLNDLVGNPNDVDLIYSKANNTLSMKVNSETYDPFATLYYSKLMPVKAEEYPYLVLKVKSTRNDITKFVLYYACGNDYYASEERTKAFSLKGGDIWQYITIDMSELSSWKGNINNIRLDIYNGGVYAPGDTVQFSYIALCKSSEEAAMVKKGYIPEGSCIDYSELLDALRPTPYFENGDITGDGNININDLLRMKLFIKNVVLPESAESYAGDVNGDGRINFLDSFDLKYRIVKGRWRY